MASTGLLIHRKTDDTVQQPKPRRRVISAGLLCFAHVPHFGTTYFLCGKDRPRDDPKFQCANKWSDFGGMLDEGETPEACAAREFVEETAGMVRFFSTDLPADYTNPFLSAQVVEQALLAGRYTCKIECVVERDDDDPTDEIFIRVCYVKHVPWQPEIVQEFRQVTRGLREASLQPDPVARRELLDRWPAEMQQHPGLHVSTTEVAVDPACLEKQKIQWWSVPWLWEAVEHRGFVAATKDHFRIGVLKTLELALRHVGQRCQPNLPTSVPTRSKRPCFWRSSVGHTR